jgi:hypothetical protein
VVIEATLIGLWIAALAGLAAWVSDLIRRGG